jgi:hypothetical protein
LRASVVARLGGGAAYPGNAGAWRGRERASHQTRSLPGPLAHDRRLVALSGARVVTIGDELGPDGLELGVWLARSLPRYAARNFSIEKTLPRESM